MCSLENGNNEKHQPLFAKNHTDEMATFSEEMSLPLTRTQTIHWRVSPFSEQPFYLPTK